MDIEKLLLSKAIMDKHNQMSRGQAPSTLPNVQLENFESPDLKYNIPQEFLSESPQVSQSYTAPQRDLSKAYTTPSVDAIKKSKLPDEIKKLMIEHPIEQPRSGLSGPTLSDELVEKASRLMRADASGKQTGGVSQKKTVNESNSNNSDLRTMVKEVVREVLSENGLISESSEKTNELFKFQVGKHIFEGKLTRIKKLS